MRPTSLSSMHPLASSSWPQITAVLSRSGNSWKKRSTISRQILSSARLTTARSTSRTNSSCKSYREAGQRWPPPPGSYSIQVLFWSHTTTDTSLSSMLWLASSARHLRSATQLPWPYALTSSSHTHHWLWRYYIFITDWKNVISWTLLLAKQLVLWPSTTTRPVRTIPLQRCMLLLIVLTSRPWHLLKRRSLSS